MHYTDPVIAKRDRIQQLAELLGYRPIDLLNVVASMEAGKSAPGTESMPYIFTI